MWSIRILESKAHIENEKTMKTSILEIPVLNSTMDTMHGILKPIIHCIKLGLIYICANTRQEIIFFLVYLPFIIQ